MIHPPYFKCTRSEIVENNKYVSFTIEWYFDYPEWETKMYLRWEIDSEIARLKGKGIYVQKNVLPNIYFKPRKEPGGYVDIAYKIYPKF